MATVNCCSDTITGYCLPDGTPIGIVLQNGAQIGWIDLTTGTFSAGSPPNGVRQCAQNTTLTGITGTMLDAFNRLRVSSPFTNLDAVHQYNLSPLFWDQWTNNGSVMHLPLESSALLTVSGTTGDFSRFQSHRYLRYRPGKSDFSILTGLFGAGEAGVTRRWGLFDNDDGIFLEQEGLNGFYVVRRTSTSGTPVDNRVAQASWNTDKLDGTGSSGVILDPTKMQLFLLDLQWLSIGRVRWIFEFNGVYYPVHMESFANVIDKPYTKTVNLPLRYEILNTADTGVVSTMKATCQVNMTEGGVDPTSLIRSVNNGITTRTIGTTRVPLIAIRPKFTFNGLTNRGTLQIIGVEMEVTGDVLWELFYRPTLTAPTWNSAGANSIAEFDVVASAVNITNAELLDSGYKSTGPGRIDVAVDLERVYGCLDAPGTTPDIFSLCVTSLGGNISGAGSITFREEY